MTESKADSKKRKAIEKLPNEDMRIIALVCGIGVAKKLMAELPGCAIYVPVKK